MLKLPLFKRIFLPILLLVSFSITAQDAVFIKQKFDGRIPSSAQEWSEFANQILGSSRLIPILAHDIKSPHGRHLSFNITIDGKPVHERQLKLHFVNGEDQIRVSHNVSSLIAVLQHGNTPIYPSKSAALGKECWLYDGNELLPATAHFEQHLDKPGEWLVYKDLTGNEIKRVDQNLYFHKPVEIDTPVQGRVFNPDPITSSQKTYGNDGLTDRSDSNSAQLEAALFNVTFNASFRSGMFYLEDEDFEIVPTNLGDPIPAMASPIFNFNRSQPEFEAVNAFFHLQTFKRHIDRLGYKSLPGHLTFVDPRCCRGDESMFTPSGLKLNFGIGGIDDAEDADIMVHEYTHALSYGASPGSNSGPERMSLDEGICDYMAGSYSNAISTWQWEKVFNWDGNMTWQGRSLNSARVYPYSPQAGIHRNGEIISGALMKLWFDLGRDVTDQLVLESLYYLVADMTMPQYAEIIMDMDSVIFGGIHRHIIRQRMAERKLMQASNLKEHEVPVQWKFLNSEGFAAGNKPLTIEHLDGTDFAAILFDVQGRQFLSLNSSQGQVIIAPEFLPSGVYLIRLSNRDSNFTTRLLRF